MAVRSIRGTIPACRRYQPLEFSQGCAMSSFMLYVIGFFILLAGLVYAAYLVHIPQTWIVVGALIVVGLGVMSAVSQTKRRDPPGAAPPPA
jgi:positive regulator of sigma E activity